MFMWPPLWSILVCEISKFWAKATDSDSPLYFSKCRRPEVTKNPYYVLPHKWSRKKVSAHGLLPKCRGVYIQYFKINSPIFCSPLFSENYLNPQARINKTVKKHTVDYHPSPSQLISMIHSLTPSKGFISQESLLNFFPEPVYCTMVEKKFQIYSVKITGKYICDSKN